MKKTAAHCGGILLEVLLTSVWPITDCTLLERPVIVHTSRAILGYRPQPTTGTLRMARRNVTVRNYLMSSDNRSENTEKIAMIWFRLYHTPAVRRYTNHCGLLI